LTVAKKLVELLATDRHRLVIAYKDPFHYAARLIA